jgi:hypothetical protein
VPRTGSKKRSTPVCLSIPHSREISASIHPTDATVLAIHGPTEAGLGRVRTTHVLMRAPVGVEFALRGATGNAVHRGLHPEVRLRNCDARSLRTPQVNRSHSRHSRGPATRPSLKLEVCAMRDERKAAGVNPIRHPKNVPAPTARRTTRSSCPPAPGSFESISHPGTEC